MKKASGFVFVNKWSNTVLQKFCYNDKIFTIETTKVRDKKGTLLRNETPFGFFECYSKKELEKFLISKI